MNQSRLNHTNNLLREVSTKIQKGFDREVICKKCLHSEDREEMRKHNCIEVGVSFPKSIINKKEY